MRTEEEIDNNIDVIYWDPINSSVPQRVNVSVNRYFGCDIEHGSGHRRLRKCHKYSPSTSLWGVVLIKAKAEVEVAQSHY